MTALKYITTKNSQITKFRTKRLVGVEWEVNSIFIKKPSSAKVNIYNDYDYDYDDYDEDCDDYQYDYDYDDYDEDCDDYQSTIIKSGNHPELAVNKWRSKWIGSTVHSDGSCGHEYLTPPVSGNFAYDCIKELGKALKKDKAKVNDDCSIHVHVDGRDLRWDDIKRLMSLYSKVEPLMYIIGGIKRYKSDYCNPSAAGFLWALANSDWKEAIQRNLSVRPGGNKHTSGRYKGLNLVPWISGQGTNRTDTTVEFRIHKQTLDYMEVINWAELCALVVDFAKTKSQKQIDSLSKYPMSILTEIAPHLKNWMKRKVTLCDTKKSVLKYNKGIFNIKYNDDYDFLDNYY